MIPIQILALQKKDRSRISNIRRSITNQLSEIVVRDSIALMVRFARNRNCNQPVALTKSAEIRRRCRF